MRTDIDSARARMPGDAELVIIDAVAAQAGVPAAQVALAWALGRPGISSVVIGARRMDQFETNLGALAVTLSETHRAALDKVSAPKLNFPAENNAVLAPSLQFAGATVDGRPSAVSPLLRATESRY